MTVSISQRPLRKIISGLLCLVLGACLAPLVAGGGCGSATKSAADGGLASGSAGQSGDASGTGGSSGGAGTTDDAGGDTPGTGGADGAAACFPLFYDCKMTTECCAPYRCLTITGTPKCQEEGPVMRDDAGGDAAGIDVGDASANM